MYMYRIYVGVFFIKNSSWSVWLMKETFAQSGMLIHRKSPTGISYPFEYEQRSFHYLLNTKMWSDRHLPKYKGKRLLIINCCD